MRVVALLVALLLVPSAMAGLELEQGQSHIDATTFQAVITDGQGGQKTHQQMVITITQGDRTWFTTDTLHEHDGIGVFASGIYGPYQVIVEGDGESHALPAEGQWQGMAGFEPVVSNDGRTFQQEVGTMAEWVVRGQQGVWLRGWVRADTVAVSPVQAINVAEQVEFEYRSYGRSYSAVSSGLSPEPMIKPTPNNAPAPCTPGEVRLDPEEVYLGNPIRVSVGDRGSPKGTVHFRLLRDVTNPTAEGLDADPLQEEILLEWESDGPNGASSFRVPSAELYRLQVTRGSAECEQIIEVVQESNRVIQVEDDQDSFLGMDGTNLTFRTDVPNSGHYEHPTSVSYQDGDTSFLVWAGKLHSHGGAVQFTIPDPLPGNYTVRWDTGAQGPDPIVPDAQELSYTVELQAEEVDTPAPLGVMALLALAFFARRLRI